MIKDTAVQILLEHFSEGMVRTIVDAIAEDEREKCAERANVALLGTLQTTRDRVLKAIKGEKSE